jgi:formate C-acetyltransferase
LSTAITRSPDQLIEAVSANWEGHENLRQLCVNGVPKYGNDDDYADDWAIWIANAWADLIDWLNTRKDLIPDWGGRYLAGGLVPCGSAFRGGYATLTGGPAAGG